MTESANYYQQIQIFFQDKRRIKIMGRLISGFMLTSFMFLSIFVIFSSLFLTSVIWFNSFILIALVWLNIAILYYLYLLCAQKHLYRSKSLSKVLIQYVQGMLIGAIAVTYTLIVQTFLSLLSLDNLSNFWFDFIFVNGFLIYFKKERLGKILR